MAEDNDGYVRLTPNQAQAVRNVVYQANVQHDADEMDELSLAKDRDRSELDELQSLLDTLLTRPYQTPEDKAEIAQL